MGKDNLFKKGLSCSARIAITFFLVVAPFFSVGASEPDKSYPSVTFWPIAYHYEDTERARTDVIWPIYHQTRQGTHNRLAIRPFLFNYEKDNDREFRQINVLWPFTHFEYEKETFRKWVFPFYYQVQNEFETGIHLWPFYGHSQKSDGTESWSTLYPFFQYRENETDSSWQSDYFWPIGRSYQAGETSGSYFFPLWWRKTEPDISGGYIFPYFWHKTPQKQQKAIIPLWYSSRSDTAETDFLLLWYSQRDEEKKFRTLFPLYWEMTKSNGHGFSLFAPLYWSSVNEKSHVKVLFPFYFRHHNVEHQTTLRYYFPFYGDYRKGDHIRDRYYLFPLYVKIDDPEQQRKAWYFLWPLVYAETTPDSFESWAIPFYWIDLKPERERRMVLGLYWSDRSPAKRMSLLFPVYYRYQSEKRQITHFWPFYGLMENGSYRENSVIWPLFRWGNDPEGDRKAWQFLLAYGKTTPTQNYWGLFPLWHHDEKSTEKRNISLLHWQVSTPDGNRQFSLLHAANPDWSLFTTKNEGGKKHHHLFPLYSYTANPEENSSRLWLLGPIYLYARSGTDNVKHRFLWKVLYSDRLAEEKESGFLWRLIRSKTDADGSLFEFNPFYYSEKQNDGESFTSWLGGLYAVRENAEGVEHRLFWLINW